MLGRRQLPPSCRQFLALALAAYGFAFNKGLIYQGFGRSGNFLGFFLKEVCENAADFCMKQFSGNGFKSLLNSKMPTKHDRVQSRGKRSKTEVQLTLGQLIQNYREQTGVSVRGLAKQLGISFSMVSAIERDKTFPRRPTLDSIAKLLEITPAELLKLDTRLRFDRLRRILAKSPELNDALHVMVEQIRTGKASPRVFATSIAATAAKY